MQAEVKVTIVNKSASVATVTYTNWSSSTSHSIITSNMSLKLCQYFIFSSCLPNIAATMRSRAAIFWSLVIFNICLAPTIYMDRSHGWQWPIVY